MTSEHVARFGVGGGLTGIATDPSAADGRARPGVVLVTSGEVHRVGACRLYVSLARHLSARGAHALRFDLSGVGDSPARQDAQPREQTAPLEIRAAVDLLAGARGLQNFALVWLGERSELAIRAARADDRLSGLVLPLAPETRGAVAALRRLIERGVRLLVVGADPAEAEDLRLELLRGVCPAHRAAGLTCLQLPRATPDFARLDHQRFLLEAIAEWYDGLGGSPREEAAEIGPAGAGGRRC